MLKRLNTVIKALTALIVVSVLIGSPFTYALIGITLVLSFIG